MRKQLSEKLKEAVASVIPVTLIVLLLQIITPMPTNMLIAFLIGAVMLVLGMGLFSLGADIAMMPMGERIGAHIIKSKHYLVLIPAVFMIGALITVAEPDLQVLADQFETLNRWAVILTVAAGVGSFLVLALVRIIKKIQLTQILLALYVLVFAVAGTMAIDNGTFIPVAFDSGGVTTGPITVPFFMALGIGFAAVRGGKNADPMKALKMGSYTSAILVAAGSVALSYFCFGGINTSFAIICGLIVGLAIGFFTEVYTSDKYRFVKNIAEQSTTGSATNIICGLSTGMLSTCVSIILVCLGILGAYKFAGLYGIALAAVGMLSTAGMTVAVDAYGPIADNAGGIAEMAGLEDSVRDITDRLDSVGNTTAAMGKGFAIGSAALTAMALFVSYAQAAELQMIDILDPFVIIGLLLGGMLPFLFSALTMSSVSKAAESMIREVRRQFKEHAGILKGTERPDYRTCVSIAATSALKEMILPGAIAIVAPLLVGFLLGPAALGGLLAGSVVTGVLMAIFMSNSGGAWDNAKKYIEGGNFGGKGSEAHKAAVVGDTVGDPFKDTSGPSINILIKLMTIVSLVFVPLMK